MSPPPPRPAIKKKVLPLPNGPDEKIVHLVAARRSEKFQVRGGGGKQRPLTKLSSSSAVALFFSVSTSILYLHKPQTNLASVAVQ